MTIRIFDSQRPTISPSAYIDETALVIGDVTIAEDCSLWPMAVVRGDVESITIGKMTNIQDACVLHVSHDSEFNPGGSPLKIGKYVTVGHHVVLHACTVGNSCLIGMASTILDGAVLADQLMIGAGSLVPAGKRLEGGYLYFGNPVKQIRLLTEKELRLLKYSAKHYVKLKNEYLQGRC